MTGRPWPSSESGPADPVEAVVFAAERFVLDPAGAAFHPETATLIVADLHLEKASACARRGILLPPYDSIDTLALLEATARRFAPRRIVALGDSFHDDGARRRLPADAAAALHRLCRSAEFIWIAGNHDPTAAGAPSTQSAMMLGAITLCHEPAAESGAGRPILCGHLHPCGRVVHRGRALRRRCFVVAEQTMILPAFGSFTGSLNVLDGAFPAEVRKGRAFLIDQGRILGLPVSRLCGD